MKRLIIVVIATSFLLLEAQGQTFLCPAGQQCFL